MQRHVQPVLDLSRPEATGGRLKGAGQRAFLGEAIRFGITGVLNTALCLFILFVLHDRLHLNLWIASTTGYAVATVQSFLINKYWTFAGEQQAVARTQFLAFVVLNILAAGIFSTGVNIMTPFMGLGPASIMSTAVTTVFNFLGARIFVFRRLPGGTR